MLDSDLGVPPLALIHRVLSPPRRPTSRRGRPRRFIPLSTCRIAGPAPFVTTNVLGVQTLLSACVRHEIEHVDLRVADSFSKDCFCIRTDRRFDGTGIVEVNEAGFDAESLERVREGVVGSAVERRAAHDVIAALGDVLSDGKAHRTPAAV